LKFIISKTCLCFIPIQNWFSKSWTWIKCILLAKKFTKIILNIFLRNPFVAFCKFIYLFIEIQPLQRTRGQPYNRWCEFITTYDKYWVCPIATFLWESECCYISPLCSNSAITIFPMTLWWPLPSQGNNAWSFVACVLHLPIHFRHNFDYYSIAIPTSCWT
jgi:hypothetical protein